MRNKFSGEPKVRIRSSLIRVASASRMAAVAMTLILMIGCKNPVTVTSLDESSEAVITDGNDSNQEDGSSNQIDSSSSPTAVAKAALAAAKANDHAAMLKLVAAKKIAADLQSITGGRTQFSGLTAKSADKVAASIAATLRSLDTDSWTINTESIDGPRARVSINATKNGKATEHLLYFFREDGLWKLVSSER